MFKSKNYELHVSAALHVQIMNKVKSILDTGAGPNLIKKVFVYPTWAPQVKWPNFLELRSGNTHSIRSEIGILLLLHVGDLRIRE